MLKLLGNVSGICRFVYLFCAGRPALSNWEFMQAQEWDTYCRRVAFLSIDMGHFQLRLTSVRIVKTQYLQKRRATFLEKVNCGYKNLTSSTSDLKKKKR